MNARRENGIIEAELIHKLDSFIVEQKAIGSGVAFRLVFPMNDEGRVFDLIPKQSVVLSAFRKDSFTTVNFFLDEVKE